MLNFFFLPLKCSTFNLNYYYKMHYYSSDPYDSSAYITTYCLENREKI